MSKPDLTFLGSFPAFTVLASGEAPRVMVKLKNPRSVVGLGDFGDSAYVAGFVDAPEGGEEAVFAFLTEEEDRRMLKTAPRPLGCAVVEGRWADHVVGVGFSLRDCVLHEEA